MVTLKKPQDYSS